MSRPIRLAVLGLAFTVVGALAIARIAARPRVLDYGAGRIVHLQRVQTGHQRAERVAFLDGGRLIAVTCPRYDRLVLYGVDKSNTATRLADIALGGKPMAVRDAGGRFLVLERPSGDARHLEPGYLQVYSYEGAKIGERFAVGYDPDDLAIVQGESLALVLLSGNAEGETNRPAPSLAVVELTRAEGPRIVADLPIGAADFDPTKIVVSQRESHAALLGFDGTVVGIDLSDPRQPAVTGTTDVRGRDVPVLSASEADTIVLPARTQADTVALGDDAARGPVEVLATLDPDAGKLVLRAPRRSTALGEMELPGPGNLGTIRACGLAYEPARRLVAVADRSGGLHVLVHEPAR